MRRIAADVRAGVETLAVGVLLGLADRRTLHALDALWYRLDARYASAAHNRRGLLAWEQAAIARHFPAAGRILVIGAGGGREVLALARRGYDVVGYECNGTLRAAARRVLRSAGVTARVHAVARDVVPPPQPVPCDAAIVGWSAYMLIAGAERRVALLDGIRRWLRPEAPVLLSFFTRLHDDARLERIARSGSALRRLRGAPELEYGDDLAPTYVHRFARTELENELMEAGFALVRFEAQGAGPEDSGWAVARTQPAAGEAAAMLVEQSRIEE